MEYISLDSFQHYKECSKLVEGMGFHLVELKISPQKGVIQIQSVVACRNSNDNITVNDCAKVHRVLLDKLEELLGTDNLSMELSSPGMERNIKNAAEFPFFIGRKIRVWDKETTDWIGGTLVSADEKCVSLKVDESEETKTVSLENIAKAKFIHL